MSWCSSACAWACRPWPRSRRRPRWPSTSRSRQACGCTASAVANRPCATPDRRAPRWPEQRQLGVVAPAVEQQRMGALARNAVLDLADEDDVVAFLVLAAVRALEYR